MCFKYVQSLYYAVQKNYKVDWAEDAGQQNFSIKATLA